MIFTRIAVTSAGTIAVGTGPAGIFAVVFVGIPAIIGFGKIVRFSVGNEAEIVRNFKKSKAIPASIRRRLKSKYFNN